MIAFLTILTAAALFAFLTLNFAQGYGVSDANLISTKALPAAAANNACDALDLGAASARAARVENMEFELSVPATPALVKDKTIIFDIQSDDDSAFGSPTAVHTSILTLTGGDPAGAAAASVRFRLPTTNVERYLRAKATVLTAGGDNTAVEYTLKALF